MSKHIAVVGKEEPGKQLFCLNRSLSAEKDRGSVLAVDADLMPI